jgi:hypothetical protein
VLIVLELQAQSPAAPKLKFEDKLVREPLRAAPIFDASTLMNKAIITVADNIKPPTIVAVIMI